MKLLRQLILRVKYSWGFFLIVASARTGEAARSDAKWALPAGGYLAWVLALLGRRPGTRRFRKPPSTPRSASNRIRVIASTRPRFASSVSRPCRYWGVAGTA